MPYSNDGALVGTFHADILPVTLCDLWFGALMATYGQNGLMGVLLLKAPNIMRLDGAGVASNLDLYTTADDQMVREYLTREADEYGEVSVRSLFKLKRIIARTKGVRLGFASCPEVGALLFLAKGDYVTEKAPVSNLLVILITYLGSALQVWDVTIPFRGSLWITYSICYYRYWQDSIDL